MKIFKNVAEFIDIIPSEANLLGLDIGGRHIGVAYGNLTSGLCLPLNTIVYQKLSQAIIALEDIRKNNSFDAIIIGNPIEMSGKEGTMSQKITDISKEICDKLGVFGLMIDERLSTAGASKIIFGMNTKQKKKTIDSHAANLILEMAIYKIKGLIKNQGDCRNGC